MARRRLMTTDEMQILQVEIAKGISPAQSQLAPLDSVALEFWERYAAELRDAQADGIVLDVPAEMPDLTNFREGFASEPER